MQGSRTAEGVTHARASALIRGAVRPLEVTFGRPATAPALDAASVPKAGVLAHLSLDADFHAMTNNSSTLAKFKEEIVTDVARELSKRSSEVQIASLCAGPGSIVVGVVVDESEPARAATLAVEIPSGRLSKHVGTYSVKAVDIVAVGTLSSSGPSEKPGDAQVAVIDVGEFDEYTAVYRDKVGMHLQDTVSPPRNHAEMRCCAVCGVSCLWKERIHAAPLHRQRRNRALWVESALGLGPSASYCTRHR